jgi:hypothetical protein
MFSKDAKLNGGYNDKYVEESVNSKFLGLQIDSHLNWENYIDNCFLS